MNKVSDQTKNPAEDDEITLSISPEKVCFIIVKAREFDVKDEVSEPDPGSNPSDDRDVAVLEDHEDDPVFEELTSFIGALSEDEQIDLVALAWLAATIIPPAIGKPCAKMRPARIITGPPPTFSASRCLATSWRRAFRCSAIPARNSNSATFDGSRSLFSGPSDRYFATHSTSENNVGLGRQLSSFLGAASATGFGAAIEASGCSEVCCIEQPANNSIGTKRK